MNTKKEEDAPQISDSVAAQLKATESLKAAENDKNKDDVKEKAKLAPKPKSSDLFSAHDFDITIDLEVPLPCKYISIIVISFTLLSLIGFCSQLNL